MRVLTCGRQSASESAAKPSKSALKKQKALARVEKRQLEKAARAAARAQKAAGGDVQPADRPSPSEIPSRSQDSTPPVATSPVIMDALAASLEEDKTPEPEPVVEAKAKVEVIAPKPVNGAARSLPKVNGSAPSAPPKEPPAPAPAPPSPPVRHVPAPASAPESKPPAQPSFAPSEKVSASPPRRTDIENPPEKQLTPEQKEQVKKRASFVTRTLWTFIMIGGFISEWTDVPLWICRSVLTRLVSPALLLMGHVYMVILVMLCQTLVYREVTALFSLKRKDSGENVRGRDPWSKTLNWYFFAVTNYFLYGESIIYYFKVRPYLAPPVH